MLFVVIGETIDIANAILYLASKHSDYSNGAKLVVDAGYEIMFGDLVPRPGGCRQFAIKNKFYLLYLLLYQLKIVQKHHNALVL